MIKVLILADVFTVSMNVKEADFQTSTAYVFEVLYSPVSHAPGVIAYSIGIAWAAQDELEYIATDPNKDHSFFVDEFDNLYKYLPKIIHNICNEFNSQPRN